VLSTLNDRPRASRNGRQRRAGNHEADRHQRAERLKAGDEIDDDKREKHGMQDAAAPLDRPQEARIEASMISGR